MFSKQVFNFIIFTGAVLSAFLIFYAGYLHGPGITFDSVNYLYAGYSFYQKGTMARPFGEPFVAWPPLYSFIIAGLSALPGKLLTNVFYFQVVVTGYTVWLLGKLTRLLIQDKYFFIFCFISLVFSTPLLLVNHFVWSESFFVLLSVGFTLVLVKYTQEPTFRNWFVLLFLGMLLCLARHVGVFYILSGMSIVFMYSRRNSFWPAMFFGGIAIIPLVLWYARNIMLTGFIWNETENFQSSLNAYLISFNHVISTWFFPDELPVFARLVLLAGILLLLLIKNYKTPASNPLGNFIPVLRVLMFQFSSYYFLALITSYIIGELIDDRILAPAYFTGIILFFYFLQNYHYTLPLHLRKLLVCACFVWSVYPVTRALHNINFWHNQPKSFPANQPVEPWFEKILNSK